MESHIEMDDAAREAVLGYQRNEITEHHLYRRLARVQRSPKNRETLERIAADELRHYDEWKAYSGQDVRPSWFGVWLYYWISRIFGLTFGTKLMEMGEARAQQQYKQMRDRLPGIDAIIHDEHEHETALLNMLDEQHLRYMGSIVLGLNDALVELTGGLAGLTLALQKTRLIALSGLIVGIAAAMSMAASEYLSSKAEDDGKEPRKACIYTGIAYVVTVLVLIAPYLVLQNAMLCLLVALSGSVLIIAAFNFYVATAMERPFLRQFLEMAIVSLGVAAFSFGLGYAIRVLLGVEV
ncbi:MAG: VIT1/CCC1 transporter family protein [Armatimonadota bacterium]